MIEKLQQLNVPYRIENGTGTIQVPASQVYELRMKLGAAGLPKGGGSGYDSLNEGSPFGRTQRRVEPAALSAARENRP